MRKIVTRVAFAIALTVGVTLYAGRTTSSSKVVEVKGEWNACDTLTQRKQQDDNQLVTVTINERLTGSFTGSYEGIERRVVRKNDTASFSGSGTFTGELNGQAGTAIVTYSGTVDSKGVGVAHWVIDQGTDGLARIDGRGTFQGTDVKPPPPGCTDSTVQSARHGSYSGDVDIPQR